MRLSRIGALALTGLFLVAACGGGSGSTTAPTTSPATAPPVATTARAVDGCRIDGPDLDGPGIDGPDSMAPNRWRRIRWPPESMAPGSPSASDVMNPAANLRVDLNYMFGEHLILAAKATGSALGGRTDEFNAYADLLNKNGTDIGAVIGQLYGPDAQDKFNAIWSAHNGFFVDYTTGRRQQGRRLPSRRPSTT